MGRTPVPDSVIAPWSYAIISQFGIPDMHQMHISGNRRNSHLTINLIYIRAAIRSNTDIDLPLPKVLQYLVEEGLVTPAQAKDPNLIFRGYGEYFDTNTADITEAEVDEFVLLEDEDL